MSNWMHRVLADAAGVSGREVIPRIVTVANPAAGAEWTQTVPGGVVWFVQSISARFVADANVSARSVTIAVGDGNITVFKVGQGFNQSAGAVVDFSFLVNLGDGAASAASRDEKVSWPNLPIIGGWSISSSVFAKQVGDQWSSIFLYVLEIEETPYDVEVLRDLANLAGKRADAVPQLGLE